MTWTRKSTHTTQHNHVMVFGRKVDGCPRCDELKNGAEPVRWSITRKAEIEAEQIRAILTHDCKKSGCGPVCTFGEW